MADASDGRIIIDTELDTTGFEKGSEKLQKAIKSLETNFTQPSDALKSSIREALPLLSQIATHTAKISAAFTSTATQTAAATDRIVDGEQRVKQAAEEATAAVNNQGSAANTFSAGVNQTKSSVAALEKEVDSLSSGLQSVSNSAETGFANGKAVLAFDAKLQELEQRLIAARERLAEFGNTQTPTEAYTSLTQQIEKAEQALFKMYDRRDDMQALGVEENSAQWQRLALQIANAEVELARYERERETLTTNGGAFISGAETAEYAQMKASLDSAGEVLNRNRAIINQEALEQARLNVLMAQEAVAAARTTHQRKAALEHLRAAQEALNKVASSMSSSTRGSEPTKESISGWQRFGKAIKSSASSALKDFTKQGDKSQSMVESLIRSLSSLKRMLITRVKRMFISSIFNSAKEGIQTLARFSDAFNQSMSNIKNSAKELSANLAVSLGGLVSAVEPMLTKIINAMSSAISYVNAFFAMLSGKSTMTVAKKQTEDYAKSLSGAAGAAEELQNQVYGFDELNRRSDTGNDSGYDGPATDGSDMFEEVPIDSLLPDSIESSFQSIKDAIAACDWNGVGEIIASGLNGAMQTVDEWISNTIRPLGVKWAGNIAEALNGLADGINWELLGNSIAAGLNTIADIFNTFMDTINFEGLGSELSSAMNGLVDSIGWSNIGQSFAQKWQSLVELIHGFVQGTNWANLGSGIGTAIQGWFAVIDWTKLGDTITAGIDGLVTTCRTTIQTIRWFDISTDLMNGVETAIMGINWGNLGALVSDAVLGLLNSVFALIIETDWGETIQSIISGIGTFIENISWIEIIEKLSLAIVALIAQIPDIVLGALVGITDLLGNLFSDVGLDSVAGFFKGIEEALKDAKAWLREHLVDPIVNWVKDLFGVHSPSTVFSEIGDNLIAGLFAGISGTWGKITDFFSTVLKGLKETLSEAWEGIKQKASEKWENIKTEVSEKFDNAKTKLSKTAEGIKTSLSTAWENVKTNAGAAWENIKTTIPQKLENAKTTLSKTAEGIKNTMSMAWENVKSKATSAWESISSTTTQKFDNTGSTLAKTAESIGATTSSIWDNLKSNSSASWDNIKTSVTSAFGTLPGSVTVTANNIKAAISTAWGNIQSATTTAWNSLKSSIMNLWNGIKSSLQSTTSSWSSVGTNLVNGLRSGISSAWSSLTSTVSSLANTLTSTLQRAFSIHSPSKVWAEIGEYLDLGLVRGIEGEQGTILKTVSNLAKNVSDKFDTNEATLQVGTDCADMVSRLSALSDKLSDIATAFWSISDRLSSIGNLKIPAIAAGTVVPYKTRIAENSASDLFGGQFEAFSRDLDERMYDQGQRLERLIDLISRKQFVNNEDLAQAIVFEMRRTVRGYGM